MLITLDGKYILTAKDFHDTIQKYSSIIGYGRNLDALYDSLTEMSDTTIVWKNIDILKTNLGAYADAVIAAFKDAEEDNEGLTLVFE